MTKKEKEHFIIQLATTMAVLDKNYTIKGRENKRKQDNRLGALHLAQVLFGLSFLDIYLANKEEGRNSKSPIYFYRDVIIKIWS